MHDVPQLEERKKNNEGLRSMFGGGQTEEEERFSTILSKIAEEHKIESVTAVALACEWSRLTISSLTFG